LAEYRHRLFRVVLAAVGIWQAGIARQSAQQQLRVYTLDPKSAA
jgi:hypothetical protein